MSSSDWIKKLNALDPAPKNKYDKSGHHLLAAMEYYGVRSLAEISEEQLKKYYETLVGGNKNV